MSKKTHSRYLLDDSDPGVQPRTFPIQRLPLDVLAEIFVHCLPGPTEEKSASTRRAPLLLCSVCTSWRDLAVSTPRLWSRFEFSLDTDWTPRIVGIEGIVKGIHSWLGLSGTLPLVLHVTFFPVPQNDDKVQQLYNGLCKYASRWEDVRLYLPASWRTLGDVPLLRRLCIDGLTDALPFTSTPRLNILTLMAFYHMPRDIPSIPWHQLIDLTIIEGTTCHGALDLIQCCPRLQSLSLYSISNRSEIDMPCCPRIRHDKLRSVEIDFSPDCRLVLESLAFPALTRLELGYNIRDTNPHVFENDSFFQELFNFLSHSGCILQRLALSNPGFTPDRLLECLGHKSCRTLRSLFIMTDDDDVTLVGDEFFTQLTYSEKAETTPLCPKLDDLTLSWGTSKDLSPGLLGKMVWSRFFGWEVADRLGSLTWDLPRRCKPSVEDYVYLKVAEANGLVVSLSSPDMEWLTPP